MEFIYWENLELDENIWILFYTTCFYLVQEHVFYYTRELEAF